MSSHTYMNRKMSKKDKLYKIESKDDETSVYGSFHLSDIKMMANSIIEDLDKKDPKDNNRKAKKTLLKRLRKLIED